MVKSQWNNEVKKRKSENPVKTGVLTFGEDYLKTLEVEQEETLLDNSTVIEDQSEEKYDFYQQSIPSIKEFPILKKYIFQAFRELTGKQQIVLNSLVLEGLGLREISECMDISLYAVSRIRDRALKSLGSILIDYMIETPHKTQRESKTAYL